MEQMVIGDNIPDVVFAGFLDQSQLPRAYVASDIFVLPSLRETWGIVVNEAMNFSLPIVVTDKVGSALDLVVNGNNGFVVPHQDHSALERALERLIASAELRLHMGERSLRRISEWHFGTTAEGVVQAALVATGRRTPDAVEGRWESPLSGVR
jgi:glycosyltransferase involved in cell wall biosynthesis